MPDLETLLRTGVAVGVLCATAIGVLWGARVARRWAPATAILRAAAQLAVVSLLLTGIIGDPAWVAVALVVMFAVAVGVAHRRGGSRPRDAWRTALAIAAGVTVSGIVVFVSGAIEFSPRYVLAVGAMVLGNAMAVAAQTARRRAQLTLDRWAEVEAWLSLGATPRQATADLGRSAVFDALVPAIDQTRTTGLVVLPGAFVGAIFGGLSPVAAGQFQLVVLAAILAAGTITAVLLVRLGDGVLRPEGEPATR